MSNPTKLLITLPGGRRVDAQVGDHLVHTDQPKDHGGDDSAPSPFDLFLASLGACAGVFIQGFCAKRGIPFEGIRIEEHAEYAADGGLLGVTLDIDLPAEFPEKYREAIIKVAERCSVKQAILAQPRFHIRAAMRPATEAPAPH